MQNFWIKELRALGKGEDAVIEFSDGLNLIQGRSQTGKTWIMKSIYYLFGSDKRPFNPDIGYHTIQGIFSTKRYGDVTITRNLDEDYVFLASTDDDEINGFYYIDYSNSAGRKFLDDFWLSVIGIDEQIMVPKNQQYERQHLTWTSLASMFFVDEGEVDNEGSIFLHEKTYETALVSSLIYLLSGDYKEGVERLLSKKEIEASKEGASKTVSSQIEDLKREKTETEAQLDGLEMVDVEAETARITELIGSLQEEIDVLLDEDSYIAGVLSKLRSAVIAYQFQIENNESLLSDYKADIRRMDFILKGESALDAFAEDGKCPVCGNAIEGIEESYIEAIRAESTRIVSQCMVIVTANENLAAKKVEGDERIAVLQERHREIQASLRERKADISALGDALKSLDQRSVLRGKLDFIVGKIKDYEAQKRDINKTPEKQSKYHAKTEFKALVGEDFDDILAAMAEECNFFGGKVTWDFTAFDIRIDDIPKAEHEGKGHRSVLNSMVGLMFYLYFNSDHALFHPGILMIDSPFHGLDESEETAEKKLDMTSGFFNFLLSNRGSGQIIIAENLDKLPKIDFEEEKVNVTTYHKVDSPDKTYGFIPDLRDDLPKE